MSNFIRNLGSLTGLTVTPPAPVPAPSSVVRGHGTTSALSYPPPSPPPTASQTSMNPDAASISSSSSSDSLDMLSTPDGKTTHSPARNRAAAMSPTGGDEGSLVLMKEMMQAIITIKTNTEGLEAKLDRLATALGTTQTKVDELTQEVKAVRTDLASRPQAGSNNEAPEPAAAYDVAGTTATAIETSLAKLDNLSAVITNLVSEGIAQGLRAFSSATSTAPLSTLPVAALSSPSAPAPFRMTTAAVAHGPDQTVPAFREIVDPTAILPPLPSTEPDLPDLGEDVDMGVDDEHVAGSSQQNIPDDTPTQTRRRAGQHSMPSKTMQKRREGAEKRQSEGGFRAGRVKEQGDADGAAGQRSDPVASSSGQPRTPSAEPRLNLASAGADDESASCRRSGRQPKVPIRYTEDEALVKARKRPNGGYKHRAFPRRKTSDRAKPATFYEEIAKMDARLRVSDGVKRGAGVWPDKAPNTQRGLLQEIVCDMCKGRVHWSCAGLKLDDDPIDDWLCPDCDAFLDSGRHRDDIEQAPLDRCIRSSCILRAKQAIVKMEDDELQYQVERIVGRRATARIDGVRVFEYLVKWVGWDMGDSTWEPRENFAGTSMNDTFVQHATALGVRLNNRTALLPEAARVFDPESGKLMGAPESSEEEETEEEEEVIEAESGAGAGRQMSATTGSVTAALYSGTTASQES